MGERLIDRILSRENLNEAYLQVVRNKGCAGVDGMNVEELGEYIRANRDGIINSIRDKTYTPQPVKRVFIPKANGKLRPLGIPVVMDRVIQQAVSQKLTEIYEPIFSESSCGFRPGRDCHMAISKALDYLNEGYEWIVDLDIEKFFDKVNQDKLISILREKVNESEVVSLVRKFLKAGVMENGVKTASTEGVPQGGPLSPILANIYLDKFDKELEQRGKPFVRYADDCIIFCRSEKAADRTIRSVVSWLERKLFLKVNATKTKVTRPTNCRYLGFTFFKVTEKWECKPCKDSFTKLKDKIKALTVRRKTNAIPLSIVFRKVNQVVIGWINYFRIGRLKYFLKENFGPWLRHKIRVVILKQWKKRETMRRNLSKLNRLFRNGFSEEDIFAMCNSNRKWYSLANNNLVNFILTPNVLAMKSKDRPGLVDPLKYYLAK